MRIGVCGLGRAGKTLVQKILNEGKDELCCVICRNESADCNKDVGELLGLAPNSIPVVSICDAKEELINKNVEVVIDFSHKNLSMELAKLCVEIGVGVVICTTNFSPEEEYELRSVGEKATHGLVYAPNLTIGVNMLMEFVEKLSRIMPDWDFEIVERHEKNKKRVTTTAKLIASSIHRDDVPISAIRLDGYVGVHEVTATNGRERITIVHESFTREAFAYGALLAAKYILGKKGFYCMADVINNIETNSL